MVIVLKGLPCSWNKCSFCPFILEQGSLAEVLRVNNKIIKEAKKILNEEDYERITIFNGGSFYELPYDVILKLIDITRGRVVDIETRPEFIDYKRLIETKRILRARELVVRVGFEVFDEHIRNNILRKGVPQSEVYRLSEISKKLRDANADIEIIAYVLFGIEGITEDEVIRSVREFNELFDGVIAIRYKKYLPHHPKPIRVSKQLALFLEKNTLLVDWGEEDFWELRRKKEKGIKQAEISRGEYGIN